MRIEALVIATTSPTVLAAIITAAVSLVVAIGTAIYTRRGDVKLKELEAAQNAAQAEKDARIAYNYEALKRLYAVCEPLLFQAAEQAEDAQSRIVSLSNSARQGQIKADGRGWLDSTGRYYLISTAYLMFAPLATFSVLQRRLTSVDLGLDAAVRTRYEILRLIFTSFTNDWDLASLTAEGTERIDYDRNRTDLGQPDRERLLRQQPERYAPQGLYRAITYVVGEALTTESGGSDHQPGGTGRCMYFGEFQREWHRAVEPPRTRWQRAVGGLRAAGGSRIMPVVEPATELFMGFHPLRKPVLWRVLLAQYFLHRAFLTGQATVAELGDKERQSLDWRSGSAQPETDQTIEIARDFASAKLAALGERLG